MSTSCRQARRRPVPHEADGPPQASARRIVDYDLAHLAPAADAPKLHEDIDRAASIVMHVIPTESGAGLQDQEDNLLDSGLRAVGMNRGHGAGMTGVHGAQEGECFRAPELTQDDSVGPHPQRRRHQIIGADLGFAERAARGEQAHRIFMLQPELRRVLQDPDLLADIGKVYAD